VNTDEINLKLANEIAAYKDNYRKYKIAEGSDRAFYRNKMDNHIKNINKLVEKKKGAIENVT